MRLFLSYEKNAAGLFDYLLANPLRSIIRSGRERRLIVIDVLKEAAEAEHNQVAEAIVVSLLTVFASGRTAVKQSARI